MKFILTLPFFLLAACSGASLSPDVPVQPSVPSPQADTCQAGPYARLVGQDGTALERELILRQVRIIRPDTAVTMDFRPERLNFMVGADGRIFRISCG